MLKNRLILTALLIALSVPLVADEPKPPVAGFRAEYLAQVDDLEKKIVSLAEAIPADKYTWRPAEGVRSISEVYMHIAGGNYFIPSFIGLKGPRAGGRDLEKISDKAKVIEELKQSMQFAREVASKVKDEELDKTVKMFGRDVTVRAAMIVIISHLHEHLGQSIAYARMNGIAPPWSQAS